jgi:M6 family metalloprotease-like protein
MKRKFIFILILALIAGQIAYASPASKQKFSYTQPDGTVIWLLRQGDERLHWTTDVNGTPMALGEDGYYRPTTMEAILATQPRQSDAETSYAGLWSSHDEPFATNFGDRKVLAVLVNFTDIQFTLPDPNTKFSNMLNQNGYSYNGAIGSVRDYYVENSHNQYRPSFDVYGPVNLSHTEQYYDTGNGSVSGALMEALNQLNIDFGQYDTDDDGNIDMVLMYYAGYNEAEGAPEWTIWPHQSTTSGYFGIVGGKRVNRYFCTSEYRDNTGGVMCGIGTTCHEFAHALGLPDMYDTNYGGNGQAEYTTGSFDLMASGNYNDAGRRPPYLSAVERNMLGWMSDIPLLNGSGQYTLEPVQGDNAYQSSANLEGEYFVYEYRKNDGWDSGIYYWNYTNSTNGGLLVYHIDKSNRVISGSTTAKYLWEWTNSINAFGEHPCYYLEASNKETVYYPYFPGPTNVTTFTPLDWDNGNCGIELTGISVDGSKAYFTVSALGTHELRGTVTAVGGGAIAGAEVTLSKAAFSFAAASAGAPAHPSTALTTTTNAQGEFVFDLAGNNTTQFVLSVSKAGYEAQAHNITFPVNQASKQENITLAAAGNTLSSFGYAYIDIDGDVPSVVLTAGKTVYSITWKVDDVSMSQPTAKSNLSTGDHTYVATVTYYDGSSEQLYYFYTK